jgi:hypothetical protein
MTRELEAKRVSRIVFPSLLMGGHFSDQTFDSYSSRHIRSEIVSSLWDLVHSKRVPVLRTPTPSSEGRNNPNEFENSDNPEWKSLY